MIFSLKMSQNILLFLCLFGLYISHSDTSTPADKHVVEDEHGCRFGFRRRLWKSKLVLLIADLMPVKYNR